MKEEASKTGQKTMQKGMILERLTAGTGESYTVPANVIMFLSAKHK
jgi:hypothetical protein